MTDNTSAINEPYPPSWINRFNSWVMHQPLSAWLFYTMLLIVWELVAFLLFWATDALQWGDFDLEIFFYNFWGASILGFHYYLEGEIRDAIHESKPMLNMSSESFSELEYKFAIMPARPFLVLSIIGLAIGAFAGLYDRGFQSLSLLILVEMLNFGIVFSLFFGISYRLLRLLSMISRMYASSIQVNLFNLSPVYVLSALCAKVGLFLIVVLYSSLILEPESLLDPIWMGVFALLSVVPMAAFFLPLRGANRSLVNEKRNLLTDISRRLVLVLDQIKLCFESGELERLGELETALRTVRSEKDLVEKVPTWPWRPATVRVFLSAVFLPIFLWLIQQFLDRLLEL